MNRKPVTDLDGALVGDRQAELVAHLVREHKWEEWDLTELHAVVNLHSELHEQLALDHDFEDVPTR